MTETASSKPGRLLIVDDEPNVARVLATFFQREGWDVIACQSPVETLARVAEQPVDVVLTDLSMPEMSGIELLRCLQGRGETAPLLVLTAYGTIDNAVEAMKQGAFDYLTKPFDLEKVKRAVQRAYLHRQLQGEGETLNRDIRQRSELGGLIGASAAMQEVYSLVEKAARSQASVLLLGESGTGKELVARALHQLSGRAKKRFIGVSCAALPEELLESELFGHEKGAFTGANWQRIGRFELADGGTLFLDEIGDISPNVQAKLLRVLQEREIDRVGGSRPLKVDVRLVAATHRHLPDAIESGQFREDLYYRLRVIEIRMPPLRERMEDVPLLARHFLGKYSRRDGRRIEDLTEEALARLEAYDWPGNVRELENTIERAVVLADDDVRTIGLSLLPEALRRGPGAAGAATAGDDRSLLTAAVAEAERKLLLTALEDCEWDLDRAAASLGVSLRTMSYQVRKHDLLLDRRRTLAARLNH